MSAHSAKNAPRIVVGVDGSPSSRAALRWAVRQAALTGGMVDAVMAWQVPMALSGYAWAPISTDETDNLAEDARKALDAVVSEEVEVADGHRVTAHVVNGHPADVLLDVAADADLLVVGSRGLRYAPRIRRLGGRSARTRDERPADHEPTPMTAAATLTERRW
jgi:nucleotide-binding universal stress UspA family protein